MKTRLIGIVAAALWLVGAAGPAAADGLARFEKSIAPQIPVGVLSYKSSKALGDDGFELADVTVTPPPTDANPKPDPIAIKTITVEDLDFDSIEKKATPLFAKLRIEGITAGSRPGGIDLKQMAGVDNVSADIQLDYMFEPERKTFTLNRLELNLNGLGRLETSMVLDGVSPDTVGQPSTALTDGSLRTASIVYDDHSLLAKVIPIAAAIEGSDPQGLVAMVIALLDGARAGQGEAAQKAIDSLVAYVEDYQQPKGPLRIVFNPPDKVSSADLRDAKTADDYVKLLGIEVNYAGVRSSTPAEIPAAGDLPSGDASGKSGAPTKDKDPDKKTDDPGDKADKKE